MSKQMGVGVIGCGSISGNHFSAIKQTAGAVVVAVCDIDEEKLAKTALAEGAAAYTDYHDLLQDERVDAVHICTPHYLHAPIAIAALKAGKHVLTEKPMAISADEADQMVEAAKESGKQLGVCFQNRYNAATRFIEAQLEKLGAVKGGCAMVMWDRGAGYYASGDWRGKWATEGGALMINQAIHTLDLLRYFGGNVVDVKASMSTKRNGGCIEAEDTCDLLLTTDTGARLLFYASNCAGGNWPVQLNLHCENGDVEMVGNRVFVSFADGTQLHEDFTDNAVYGKDYWGKGHLMLVEDFYRCLAAGEAFPISGEEALKTTLILEKAYTDQVPTTVRPY